MTAVLELAGVVAGYGPLPVLHGVELTVGAGEIVCLIGGNGAGKTTTLMCVSGIVRARAGAIRFAGQEITRLSAHAIARAGLAQVPEGRKIFAKLSVLENLRLGGCARGGRGPGGMPADLERAFALFPILAERRQQPGGTLSGGEQQMLAIARALMGRPTVLLMDEPSMGVAPLVVARIAGAIRQLNRDGLAILLVEQNAQLALELAHRGYVLEHGRVVLAGAAAKLREDPQVKAAYLGEP
jgi:branched-chain amino acid transport system ATP-binding protein